MRQIWGDMTALYPLDIVFCSVHNHLHISKEYIFCDIFFVDIMFDVTYYKFGGMQHERFSKITGSGA